MKNILSLTLTISLLSTANVSAQKAPFTDYCVMLEKEIRGKQHGYLAGNSTFYMGGEHAIWQEIEHETVGLTHPFFNDLRSRGTGIVSHVKDDGWDLGTGHDLWGWNFHKDVRAAYGTVYINSLKFKNPAPSKMYWRPDRMICEYELAGVSIREEKFIAENDVVSTIIRASEPIDIEFSGRSFITQASAATMRSSTASGRFDTIRNAIHITEGGTVDAHPEQGIVKIGVLMYDGMSMVISASRPLENVKQSITSEPTKGGLMIPNIYNYSFRLPVDTEGVTLSWNMADEYEDAIQGIESVLANPDAALQAKTDKMNTIFNDQVPYFRCSDDDIVKVYYYLNAVNLMYYTYKGEGQETYWHTQSAVNNFLGLHAFDNIFQSRVGSWYTDKEKYAYGNILIWRNLLKEYNGDRDFIGPNSGMPDNIGIGWNSGINGGPNAVGHMPQAWQIYEHTGDTTFLKEAYEFYSLFYPERFYGMHWGFGHNAGLDMQKMARVLGKPESEANKWVGSSYGNNAWVESSGGFLDYNWEKDLDNYFGSTGTRDGQPFYAWSNFGYGNMYQFRRENLIDMTNDWLMDSVKGFNDPLCNPTFGAILMRDLWPRDFGSAPDIAWYIYKPLFTHHVCDQGIYLTLKHLKQYNMEWGMPVAPEARKTYPWPGVWGDQYSNFNCGKIDLIIEGLGGLNYSFADSSFTVSDHLPKDWSFMEWRVPVKHHSWDEAEWVVVRTEKEEVDDRVSKTVSVSNNPMEHLIIQPWTENKDVISVDPVSTETTDFGHLTNTFQNTADAQVKVVLDNKSMGIDEQQYHTLKIFPNPVIDFARIESPSEHVNQIRITDGSGRLFYNSTSVDPEHIVLDLKSLPAGIYICQLFFDNSNLSKQFIKL